MQDGWSGVRHVRRREQLSEALVLGFAYVGQADPLRAHGGARVEVHGYLVASGDLVPEDVCDGDALLHRHTGKRHERNDVHRAEAWVLALVRAHVDLEEGGCDEGVRGGGHRVGVAGKGEDGTVVVGVARLIEEPDAGDGADGLRQSVDHIAAAAFADVWHAFHQPRHGGSVPVIPHPWGLSACRRLVRLTSVESDRDRNEQGLSLALLQFNPSSVVLLDTEGRVRSLNRNAERLLSTTEAD